MIHCKLCRTSEELLQLKKGKCLKIEGFRMSHDKKQKSENVSFKTTKVIYKLW